MLYTFSRVVYVLLYKALKLFETNWIYTEVMKILSVVLQ
jgi:hypothetical protein